MGLDLGLPFEYEGRHYFTFGDAVFDNKPPGNNDAMARSSDTLASLRSAGCLDLDFPTQPGGNLSPTTLDGPFVSAPTPPQTSGAFLGDLQVPGPGFAVQGKMFVLSGNVPEAGLPYVACTGPTDMSCGPSAACLQVAGSWLCHRTYTDQAGQPVPPASLIVPLLSNAYQRCDDDTDCEGFGVCRRRTLDGGSAPNWTSELFCHSAYDSAWDPAFDHTVDCGSDVLEPFPPDNGIDPDGPFRDCVPVPRQDGATLGVVELDSIPGQGPPNGLENLRSIGPDEDPNGLLGLPHGLGGSSFVTDPSDQRVWVFFDEHSAGTHGREPSPRLSTIEISSTPSVGAYLDSKRYCSSPNTSTIDEACPVNAGWNDQQPLFDETVRQVQWRHVSVNPSVSNGSPHRWLMVYGGHVPAFARSDPANLRSVFKFASPSLTDAVNDRADLAAVYLRTAPNPWGPWSRAQEIYNPYARPTNARDGFCYGLHFDEGNPLAPVRLASGQDFSCAGLDGSAAVFNQTLASPQQTTRGADYGAGILGGFTRDTDKGTEFYWTVSTWVPYRVMLMKTTLSEDVPPIPGLRASLRDFLFRPDRFPPYGPVPPGPYLVDPQN